MKISLGTDHAGFRYKEKVKELLTSLGHEVKDFGTWSEEPVDYPLFIRPAAQAVANGECERGIVFGGSGNGEAMAANKVRGVRCALCWNEESAKLSRRHNDANVLLVRRADDSGRARAGNCAHLVDDAIRRRASRETHRATRDVAAPLLPGRQRRGCRAPSGYKRTQRSRQTATTKTALTNALLWKKARLIPATSSFFAVRCS